MLLAHAHASLDERTRTHADWLLHIDAHGLLLETRRMMAVFDALSHHLHFDASQLRDGEKPTI